MDTDENKAVVAGGHDGFVSSGDELEPEPVDVEDAVQMVVVDADALVNIAVFWNAILLLTMFYDWISIVSVYTKDTGP